MTRLDLSLAAWARRQSATPGEPLTRIGAVTQIGPVTVVWSR